MFDDFDSMDMYGFLDYLEESTSLDNIINDINLLEESLGIYEDLSGDLQIEENFLFDTMDKHNLTEDEAIFLIMEAFEEELSLLLGEDVDSDLSAAEAELEQAKKDQEEKRKAHEKNEKSQANYTNSVSNSTAIAKDHQEKLKQPHSKKDLAKNFAKGVGVGAANAAVGGAAGAALGAGAVGVHMMYKAHKAKKEAEARRNRGLRGKLRRLREDYGIFEDEYGELFIENEMLETVMDEYDLYEEDAIDIIMESYEEELDELAENCLFPEEEEIIMEAKGYGQRIGGGGRSVHVGNMIHGTNHGKGSGKGRGNFAQAQSKENIAKTWFRQKQEEKTNKVPLQGQTDNTVTEDPTEVSQGLPKGKGRGKERKAKGFTEKKSNKGLPRKLKKKLKVSKYAPQEVQDKVQQKTEKIEQKVGNVVTKKEEPQQTSAEPKKFEYKPKDDSAYQPSTYVPRQSQEQIQQGAKEQQLARIKGQIKDTKDETDKIPTVNPQETQNNNDKANIHRANNNLTQVNNAKDVMAKYERRQKMARAAGVAVGGAAVVAGGHLAHKAYKQHKAKKEAEARRNRGLRGKLRRLREGEEFMLEEKYGIFENEYGELFIESEMVEYVMDEYDLYEEDAIDLIMECYEEELDELGLLDEAGETVKQKEQISHYYAGMNPKNNPKKPSVASRIKGVYTDAQDAGKRYKKAKVDLQNAEKIGVAEVDGEYRDVAAKNFEQKQEALKKARKDYAVASAKAAAPGALAIGGAAGAVIAHKAYKNHKAKKEAEARRNRGLRGKLRRLREDYGIFEDEYGQLFIESEMIESVMYEYDLYEEDAIDIIMESYEEELDELLYENAAQEVVAASHHQVSVEADRQLRQAEMDEGDDDRNLARGGKHILNGIRRAPRSEQDQAGEAGVRFKNRVDDGDMDGEFIDSGIQKPMGSGRRIAEDSDMGF